MTINIIEAKKKEQKEIGGGVGHDEAAVTASSVVCSEMYMKEKASHMDSEGGKMVPF